MAVIKTLAGLLVMPLPLAALLVILGLLLLWRGGRRSGGALLLAAPLLVLVAAWNPLADALLAPLERAHPPVLDARPHSGVQAVVVLGSGFAPDPSRPITGQLGASALVRLSEGSRLHRQLDAAPPLAVTGGASQGGPSMASGYAEAARALGVSPGRVVELGMSRDTAQEAYAVRDWLGADAGVLLVTSASHMPRAMRHFRHVGLDPVAAPTRYRTGRESPGRLRYWVPRADVLRKTERALHEYMGLWALRLDHR